MATFILYDRATGAVRGACRAHHNGDDAAVMAANTPAGCGAMAVDASSPVLVDQRGWSVINGALVLVPPTDAQALATAKASQLALLTAAYNAAKTANVAYLSTEFMADTESQQIFAHALTAYTALGATPSDFYAVGATYNKVPMTLAQLQGLIEAIAAQVWAAFQRWVEVKQALATATTVAEVQAVVW